MDDCLMPVGFWQGLPPSYLLVPKLNVMKHLMALLALLVSTAAVAQIPTLPWNPDENGDQFIGLPDLLSLLGVYGQAAPGNMPTIGYFTNLDSVGWLLGDPILSVSDSIDILLWPADYETDDQRVYLDLNEERTSLIAESWYSSHNIRQDTLLYVRRGPTDAIAKRRELVRIVFLDGRWFITYP